MPEMSVRQAIETRRSVRKFTTEPLSEEQIGILLEAARLAPSSVNCQPWRFKIVQGREDLAWIGKEGSKGQVWPANAAAVFLCCVDMEAAMRDSKANYKFLKDSGALPPSMIPGLDAYTEKLETSPQELLRGACAINMAIALSQVMLQAVELGLGTCWIGMFDEQAMKTRFGIPDNLPLVAMLAVGVPAESPPRRPRKALADILIP